MLRSVALVRTDVSEELSASFIRVARIDEIGTTLAVTSNRRTKYNTFVKITNNPSPVTTSRISLCIYNKHQPLLSGFSGLTRPWFIKPFLLCTLSQIGYTIRLVV
jgi:hypothetical protein